MTLQPPTVTRFSLMSLGALALVCAAAPARAQEDPAAGSSAGAVLLSEAVPSSLAFGAAGTQYYAATLEVAVSTDDAVDLGPRLAYHRFLADDLEINVNLGVWYHDQEGEEAFSVNPSLGFRYHFVNKPTHSFYAEAGIGLLFSTEDVPDEGTRQNFTPRIGLGATFPVGDAGSRLDVGLRWHHISNASSQGTDENPDRDGLGLYVGIMVPF